MIFFAQIVALALAAATPVDPGVLFLESFSSACPSKGAMTDKALSQTRALAKIFETIKEDPACQGLQPLFSSLSNVSVQLDYVGWTSRKNRADQVYSELEQLEFLLAVSDEDEAHFISKTILEKKVELVSLQAAEQGEQRQASKLALAALLTYTESINQTLADHVNCFERHRGLPIQMASQLLSMSSGFFNPSMGLAIAVAGRLISSFFDFFQNVSLAKKIRDYRSTTLQAGLICAMEALEQSVCDIHDRRSLINFIEDYRNDDQIPAEWEGYELITRDYPQLRSFFNLIESGSPSQSPEQGDRRSSFLIKEATYYGALQRINGLISRTEDELVQLNEGAQRNRIRRLLSEIVGAFAQGPSYAIDATPSSDPGAGLHLWLRTGDPTPEALDSGGNPRSIYQIIEDLDAGTSSVDLMSRDVVRNRNIQGLKFNIRLVTEASEALMRLDRQFTLLADQQGVLSQWTLSDGQSFSPGEVLERFIHYFDRLTDRWSKNPYGWEEAFLRERLELIADTRWRFSSVIEILKRSNEGPDSFAKKLSEIFSILSLRDRDQFVTDRLRSLVKMDLESNVKAGILSKDVYLEVAIRSSQRDLLQVLTPSFNSQIEPLRQDLDFAEPIARDNLLHFFDHFRPSIIQVIEQLQAQSEKFGESKNGVSQRQIDKICILALNDPQVFKNSKLVKLCDGRGLGSDDRGRVMVDKDQIPIMASFSKHLGDLESRGDKAPENRLCSFRSYQRKRQLYGDLLRSN